MNSTSDNNNTSDIDADTLNTHDEPPTPRRMSRRDDVTLMQACALWAKSPWRRNNMKLRGLHSLMQKYPEISRVPMNNICPDQLRRCLATPSARPWTEERKMLCSVLKFGAMRGWIGVEKANALVSCLRPETLG